MLVTRDVKENIPELCVGLPQRSMHADGRAMVTFTPSMFDLVDQLKVAAQHDVTVLLVGETGTGKTFLARLLHDCSARQARRFCPVPCGALPADLIESELFGHVKGAFTGADVDKQGKFAAAGEGTVLLDEIDVLPLAQQAKLLRVIESREFEPVGSNETRRSRARLVAASNVDLRTRVEAGMFRSDLFFRLNVLSFHLPPLRDRPLDLEYLAKRFVQSHCRQFDMPPKKMSAEFIDALRAYRWPGNIRELENVLRRAVLYCRGESLVRRDLPESILMGDQPVQSVDDLATPRSLEAQVGVVEKRLIEESLVRNNNHRTDTARELGISRVTLYNKMKKFGILNG